MAQEVERVPLALNWKGHVAPGGRDDHLVFTCDLPVTMLDAAGLAFTRNPVDGRSLLDLTGEHQDVPPWRDSLMCETYGHGYGLTLIGRMVVQGPYKYVCFEGDSDELYDLQQDPYEMRNLARLADWQPLRRKMQQLLAQKMAESRDPVSPERLMPV